MFHGFRVLVARESPTTILANHPPVRRSESLAVLCGVENVGPADERSPVVYLPELVILPGVNELIAANSPIDSKTSRNGWWGFSSKTILPLILFSIIVIVSFTVGTVY